jgi:peptidoglycan/LPS O-acetylase OafA/YrhL
LGYLRVIQAPGEAFRMLLGGSDRQPRAYATELTGGRPESRRTSVSKSSSLFVTAVGAILAFVIDVVVNGLVVPAILCTVVATGAVGLIACMAQGGRPHSDPVTPGRAVAVRGLAVWPATLTARTGADRAVGDRAR